MFVTVKYGDDQSRIFNINCRNDILLHHIKKRCQMDRDEVIELSDEAGAVKNLRQNLNEYGTDHLKERETLILLRVDCEPSGVDLEDNDSVSDRTVFIPMLTTMTENQEFIDIINGGRKQRKMGRKHVSDNLNPKDSLTGSKASLLDDDVKGKKSRNKIRKDKKPKLPKK